MGQRGVDIHGLPALFDLLFRGLVLHGAHIVKPVGNFDEHHPDVLGHGHEHFPQILHLLLLGGGEIGPGQLGDTLHQLRYRGTEDLLDFLVGGVGILNAVVEQRAQHGVLVQTHFRYDLGHGKRVDDVGGAVLALLQLVLNVCVVHRLVNELHIRAGHPLQNRGVHGGIVFFKGFHFLFSSLSRAAGAAWFGWWSGQPFGFRGSAGWKCTCAAV